MTFDVMNPMFEYDLPPYLAHALKAILHEQSQDLRDKYLWGRDV